MTDAALGWVVVLSLTGVPLAVAAVGSQLRKRNIWAAGKDDSEPHRGGGGGGCGGGSASCGGGCGGGGCGGGGGA